MTAVLAERPDEHRVWRRAAPHLRGHRMPIVAVAVLGLMAAWAQVGGFALIGVVTDAVLAHDRPRVVWAVAGIIALALTATALRGAGQYLVVRVGESVVRELREQSVERLASAPLRFLEAQRHGELLRRTTGELAELTSFVGGTLPSLVSAPALLAVTAVVLAGYSALLTGMLAILCALAAAVLGRGFVRRAETAFAERAAAEAAVSATFSESVPAREEIALLGARDRRVAQLAAADQRLLQARLGEVRTDRWLLGLGPAGGLAVALVLAVSGLGVQQGWLEVGGAVVFVLASRAAWDDVEGLVVDLGDLRAARTHLARVLDLLRATDRPAGGAGGLPGGALVADQVDYHYGDASRPALTGVSLRVEPGERIAVIGRTGSGKTTLGKILAGLYEPMTGEVTLGGTPLGTVGPSALRRRIAVVPQEIILVAGSIADNLAMTWRTPAGVGPDRSEMTTVADDLGLGPWLRGLPDGLDTLVGEHGARLSAGERQLVALWRAMLLDPSVLILDEATADVDPASAQAVEDALGHVAPGCTVIVIAHRPDTITRADRVIRLEAGRVAGR